jgi:centromeric protein E
MVQLEEDLEESSNVEDIKVCLRMRPLTSKENDPRVYRHTGQFAWKPLKEMNSVMQVSRGTSTDKYRKAKTSFTFDKVYDEDDETHDIYAFCGRHLIESAIAGRNGSIFAYGQTGSGKTHTMQGLGSIRDGYLKDSPGILHLAGKDLFQLAKDSQDREFVFSISVIEVYNEDVRDLLSKRIDHRLHIREDPNAGIFVKATKIEVENMKQFISILSTGEKNRVVARTTLNKRSSRSHIIYSVHIESFPTDDISGSKGSRVSCLNLIDLAGSESVRHKSSHSTEERRKEGGSINKSLLTLSRVIQALGSNHRQFSRAQSHVNYRDSKLTRVLQPSLSGNARLAFICCATSSGLYSEETKSTLQFASRIKHIKTNSQVNTVAEEDPIVIEMRQEMTNLKTIVLEMEKKMKTLEKDNQKLTKLLNQMTEERDDAMEKVAHLEKAKNAAFIAAADAVASNPGPQEKNRTRPQMRPNALGTRKPPASPKRRTAANMKGIKSANQRMSGQNNFLANVVDRLAPRRNESSTYQRRQTVNLDPPSDSGSTINGIRKNIRAGGSFRSHVSDITSPSRYGAHRSVGGGIDPDPLPLLGMEISTPNASYENEEEVEDTPSAEETSVSEEVEEGKPAWGKVRDAILA